MSNDQPADQADEVTQKPPVYWPVNDMGDDVSYLDNLSDEDVSTPEFYARQVALGNVGTDEGDEDRAQ
ncbi:MAG: hypothetical protein ACH36H_06320 [Candidatus Nanopelagicales bacterium]